MQLATSNRPDRAALFGNLRIAPLQPAKCEALDTATIAELSTTNIDSMTCDELVRMIQAAEVPTLCRLELRQRLPFYDHATLKRLAHLARFYCRSRFVHD